MDVKTWHLVIAPMHIVSISAEEMRQDGEVLTFMKEGRVVARFSSYMGWMEHREEPKERASVTPLSLVVPQEPGPVPPAA